MIPDYINCNNKEIEVCDYFITKECKKTCAYYQDIMGTDMGLGVGAVCDSNLLKRLREND